MALYITLSIRFSVDQCFIVPTRRLKTVHLHNIQFHNGLKTSGLKTSVRNISGLQNVRFTNVQFQNVQFQNVWFRNVLTSKYYETSVFKEIQYFYVNSYEEIYCVVLNLVCLEGHYCTS